MWRPDGAARLALVALLAGACAAGRAAAPAPQPFPIPPLQPFTNAHDWVLQQDLVYRLAGTSDSVVVPAGFVTDFASIPRWFQAAIPVHDPHLGPSIVHDYLYWAQVCRRAAADSLFLLAMIQQGVEKGERNSMYQTLKSGGEGAWRENQADRAAGRPRVLPPPYRTPPVGVAWPVYRERLRQEGVPLDTVVQ